MNVNVRSIQPDQSVLAQDAEFGPRLFERAPDECCALRKVLPLNTALADYDGWATGLRRDEGPTRANTRVVDFDLTRRKVKVSPIARWTEAEQLAYIERHGIPVNPLLKDGYRSVGCWPCTRRTAPGEDPRAGRWAAFDKTECGLHV
jgi:phosphoadenosine phosphosulfate reductase